MDARTPESPELIARWVRHRTGIGVALLTLSMMVAFVVGCAPQAWHQRSPWDAQAAWPQSTHSRPSAEPTWSPGAPPAEPSQNRATEAREQVLAFISRLEDMRATERHLHSELLRPEHLPFLADLRIAVFDPSADQYVSPALLREQCPVPFTGRIQSWHIRDLSAAALQTMYREIASYEPVSISFYQTCLAEEEKLAALLDVARELAGEATTA